MPCPPAHRRGRRVTFVALLAAAAALAALAVAPMGEATARAASPGTIREGAPPTGAAPLTLTTRAPAGPQPLTPAELHSAYALPLRGAPKQTIAVVSAYNDSGAQADLNAYSQRFGLPACDIQNGCLRTLNESGKASPLSPADPTGGTWITESSVGISIAHGVCQSCSILLVEANAPTMGDFSAAVLAAAHAGATVIVTTFELGDDAAYSSYASDYSQPGSVVVAASGDPGGTGQYGYTGALNFPSSLPNVLAVGGTDLQLAQNGGYGSEQAWSGTESGCSDYHTAPPWQASIRAKSACGSGRVVGDVSAVADPGAIVHVSGVATPGGPWYVVQGTSLAAPIIAGVIGLAGSQGQSEVQLLYARELTDPGAFHDILTGITGPGCMTAICKAGPGWDGPTGLGTPDGLAAYLASGGVLPAGHLGISIAAPHKRLNVDEHYVGNLELRNANPYAVTGTVVLRRTLAVGRRLVRVRFTTGRFTVGPLATGTARLTIAPRYRWLLAKAVAVDCTAQLAGRGPVGKTPVSATERVELIGPP